MGFRDPGNRPAASSPGSALPARWAGEAGGAQLVQRKVASAVAASCPIRHLSVRTLLAAAETPTF